MATISGDYVHNLASAAHRAGVSEETMIGWIERGLRAMPKGGVGKDGRARHYMIREEWLSAFMDEEADRERSRLDAIRRAESSSPPAATTPEPPRTGGRPKGRGAMAGLGATAGQGGMLGPIPTRRGQ